MVTAAGDARRPSFLATGRGRLVGAAVMVACGVVSVLDASGLALKIIVGVLMAGAEAGMVTARLTAPGRVAGAAVLAAVAAGLATTVLVPRGLGWIAVIVGVTGLPTYLPNRRVRAVAIAVVSVAFGVIIVVITRSVVGLISGVGAWALADRSVEHAAFQAERDRAVALLAQVEASRDAQSEAAAAEERNRIAREMHDVLAHSLAGLSMQLQAIRAVAAREGVPESVTGPVDRAAGLARDGLREARAATDALRAPRLRDAGDLERLVAGFPAETTWRVAARVPAAGA